MIRKKCEPAHTRVPPTSFLVQCGQAIPIVLARRRLSWIVLRATPSVRPISRCISSATAGAWEPLFAIADLAGGDWPQRARKAALALSGEHVVEDDNIGTMLLSDIRGIFGVDRQVYVAKDEEKQIYPRRSHSQSDDASRVRPTGSLQLSRAIELTNGRIATESASCTTITESPPYWGV